jgi:ketosteroid isomerase-like protein
MGDETPASTHKPTVEAYIDGFRRSDHAAILALLTDDVAWDLPGFRHLQGKGAFDGEIENPAFEGSPLLTVDRLVEEGDTVVAVGEGTGTQLGGARFRFAFCDVFTFSGDLIARVESYLVPLES